MTPRSDLFDTPEIWRIDPIKAFDAFVGTTDFLSLSHRKRTTTQEGAAGPNPMPVRASTAAVYRHMWARFVRWTADEGIDLLAATAPDLMNFLEQKGDDGKRLVDAATIRRQYLMLFERVYMHLQVQPNPATHACFDILRNRRTGLAGRNAPKAVLTQAQQQAFIDALPHAPRDSGSPLSGWKTRRDRAMQALMLGAGLKVSEVIGAYIDNIGEKDETGAVPVTISPGAAGGTIRWHRTILRPFAANIVLDWVKERRELGFPGQLLFPATPNGGRLNKATVYRHVKATFAQAGIDVPRQGGRTLRNAFAVRELKTGQSVEAVGEFLGHRKRRSLDPYLEAKDKVD